MDYLQAVDYLNDQKHFNVKPGLVTIRRMLEELGNPHRGLRYVHIAGTNGKGSTAAYIESILRTAGYRTGLFTSPYIEHFTERIRTAGEEIDEESLIRLAEEVKKAADILEEEEIYPTPFELQTAVAFLYFKEKACDIVVLEVGLGGRFDSTNIIEDPEVCVIASIGMDHMNILGDSLSQIAAEKCGIIKESSRVVTCPQKEEAAKVIEQRCRECHASLTADRSRRIKTVSADLNGQVFEDEVYGRCTIHLQGLHQITNAGLALDAVDVLKTRGFEISAQDVHEGLAGTRWKGRLEVMGRDPVVLIDGAHNADGVEALKKSLVSLFGNKKITFVTGVLADKDYPAMMRLVEPLADRFWTVTPDSPRALPAEELAAFLQKDGCKAQACTCMEEARDKILAADRSEVVCAFGSLYFIGGLRSLLRH